MTLIPITQRTTYCFVDCGKEVCTCKPIKIKTMIQQNELRIGNYIKSDDGIICEVSRIESKEFTKWN